MTVAVYRPYCTATIGGQQIDPAIVRGARVETGFADPVSKGYVRLISDPGFSQGEEVTITMGGGQNNITRFRGTILQGDWLNSGPTFELVCRGPLWAVQKYRNNRPLGFTLLDMTGGPATDEDIARAVLDIVGVAYNAGQIGGTGIPRGASAAVAYTWKRGESALDYLQRLTKASLGYKMVESPEDENNIHRVQVLSQPGGGSEYSFTQGVDIFEGGHTQKSTFEAYDAWQVTGFDYGDGLGPVSYSDPTEIGNGAIAYAYSSEMIESIDEDDPRDGMNAALVAGYIRGETDHTIVRLSGLQTPRDDLFGPGQVHHITAPWLGLDDDLNCIGVTCEVDENWFGQTLEYVG
jgi:hypothetical protein